MNSLYEWYTIWYDPEPGETIAYMGMMRIAEVGGTTRQQFMEVSNVQNAQQVNQGMAVLQRWCRLNCSLPPKPVNVQGRTGFAFVNDADALLFKLTWG